MNPLSRAEINRQNAQNSTGPRTPEGKAASSQNATKHGLNAAGPFVQPGEEAEFESLKHDLWSECQPEGALENQLFQEILHASWKLRRVRILEPQLESIAGGDALLDEKLDSDLSRLARHRARAERTFHRSLNQLRHLQTERMCRWHMPEDQADLVSPLADSSKLAKQSHVKWPKQPSRSPGSLLSVFKDVLCNENRQNEPSSSGAAAAQTAQGVSAN